jgi:hypothetical protein
MLQYLISRGAVVTTTNNWGMTVVHLLATANSAQVRPQRLLAPPAFLRSGLLGCEMCSGAVCGVMFRGLQAPLYINRLVFVYRATDKSSRQMVCVGGHGTSC